MEVCDMIIDTQTNGLVFGFSSTVEFLVERNYRYFVSKTFEMNSASSTTFQWNDWEMCKFAQCVYFTRFRRLFVR